MSGNQGEMAEEPVEEVKEPEKDDEAPPHPYAEQLAQFQPSPNQLEVKDPVNSPKLQDTPVTVVDTQELLNGMMEKLRTVSELAFEMEYNIFHSFHGVTNLIQISTRSEDFLIDPVALKDELTVLNEIFIDAKIVKVTYSGKRTRLEGLQRDFGIFVVNFFDLAVAEEELFHKYRRARNKRLHLAKILQSNNVLIDATVQKFDSNARPFSAAMIKYKREETRHMLFIYDVFRNRLIKKKSLEKVYAKCKEFCGITWFPGKYRRRCDAAQTLCESFSKEEELNEVQIELIQLLDEWRWRTAEKMDKGIQLVLSNNHMRNIVRVTPEKPELVDLCCSNEKTRTSQLRKENVDEILRLTAEAKAKFPNVKTDNKDAVTKLTARLSQRKPSKKCTVCDTFGHFPEDCSFRKVFPQLHDGGGIHPFGQWVERGHIGRRGDIHPFRPQRPRMGIESFGYPDSMGHTNWSGHRGPMSPTGRSASFGLFRLRGPPGRGGPVRPHIPRGRGWFYPY